MAGLCMTSCPIALAAPMDAFLTANRPSVPGKTEIEISYDVVNDTLDVFNVRDSSDYAGTKIGDYRGAHVLGGVAVTPRLWVDGGLWQRKIEYGSDDAKLNTWQVGAQYKLVEAEAYRPAMAIRASAWGNYADSLTKSSPTTQQGVTLNTVNVNSPKDVQYQLDLIGTWPIGKNTELSAFIGGGRSRVSMSSLTATATRGGCLYNLSFEENNVIGTLAQPCSGGADRISIPNSEYGIDVNRETEYHASYLQAGLMAKWRYDRWQVRAGYQYQTLRRDNVDDIIESRGGKTYEENHILIGDIRYGLTQNLSLFLRGQYMSNQFVGEIPFAYNTFTAHRFNQHYGIVSTGLVFNF